jgi:hypothetical protein
MTTDSQETKGDNNTQALIKQIADLQERIKNNEKTNTVNNNQVDNKTVDENEKLRQIIKELNGKLHKYEDTVQMYKKTEKEQMQKTYDNSIAPWFEGCIKNNTEVAEQFVSSLQDAIKDARTKDGVWQIALAASTKHKELIDKVNALTQKAASENDDFNDINNRKRAENEDQENDVFSNFKRRCM